jgi:hypothetical protein
VRRRKADSVFLLRGRLELQETGRGLRPAYRARKGRLAEIEGWVRESSRRAEALTRAVLLAAGFHTHNREWRRRRAMPTPAIENAGDCPLTAAEADALLSRALACDASAAPALRDCLTGPRSSDFWLHADPARDGLQPRAEEALIRLSASGDARQELSVRRELARLRRELSCGSGSPVERVLVDRVVLCWLDATASDLEAVKARVCGPPKCRWCEDRRGRAQRRFLKAVRALELCRGKAPPALLRPAAERAATAIGSKAAECTRGPGVSTTRARLQ